MKITDFSGMREKNQIIEEFQGEYRWLSNFAPVSIVLDGITYPSVEHAYVSAKSDDKDWKIMCSNPKFKSAEVKRVGRTMVPENWNEIKVDIMIECLKQKYNQEPYRTKLLETGDKYIQEGNRWNDTFWGFCLKTNLGENNLGRFIMNIRVNLQSQLLINDE